jgi:hypothetical protein
VDRFPIGASSVCKVRATVRHVMTLPRLEARVSEDECSLSPVDGLVERELFAEENVCLGRFYVSGQIAVNSLEYSCIQSCGRSSTLVHHKAKPSAAATMPSCVDPLWLELVSFDWSLSCAIIVTTHCYTRIVTMIVCDRWSSRVHNRVHFQCALRSYFHTIVLDVGSGSHHS